MENKHQNHKHGFLSHPLAFFVLVLAFTWLVQFPFIFLGEKTLSMPYVLIFYMGSISPALFAILFTYRLGDRAQIKDFWQRIIDIKRIRGRWWLVILLLHPIFNILAILIQSLFSRRPPSFESPLMLLGNPLQLLSMAIFLFFFGPLPEEIGWRGYGLDRLQEEHSPLISSLIVGIVWALWHLPLFFIPGTYQSGLGLGSLNFWLFFLALLPASVLYTWIFNSTNRGTLATIMFHFATNFSGEFFEPNDPAKYIRFVLVTLTAIIVALRFEHQGRQQEE